MQRLSILAFVSLTASCIPASNSAQKFSDAAYEVAMAHRFGRLDLVVDAVPPKDREAFVLAHEDWGRTIRILDVELGAMGVRDEGNAQARLVVGWQRVDEMTLRSSTVEQHWKSDEDSGGWYLASEVVVAGDPRLLAAPEPVDPSETPEAKPKADKAQKTSKAPTSSRNE